MVLKIDSSGFYAIKFWVDNSYDYETNLFEGSTNTLWSDQYLKKVKFFLRELAHKAILIVSKLHHLPTRALWYWGSLCKNDTKNQNHIFHFLLFLQSFLKLHSSFLESGLVWEHFTTPIPYF